VFEEKQSLDILKWGLYIVVFVLFLFVPGTCFGNELVFDYNDNFDLDKLKALEDKKDLDVKLPSKNIYILNLDYIDVVEFKNNLLVLFPSLICALSKNKKAIIIYSDEKLFTKVSNLLKEMDELPPLIKLKVKIVEVNYDDLNQYKGLFSDITNGLKINYSFRDKAFYPVENIESKLILLCQQGKANIIAKPVLTALDKCAAFIRIGDRVPYITTVLNEFSQSEQVHHLETGVDLKITSEVISDNMVLADVDIEIATIKLWKELGSSQYPLLSTRKAKTEVLIPNNATLVIAGLFDEQIKINEGQVPFLSDIPFIGNLFISRTKNKTKSDVLFLITPEIIR
jgi:type II secretory pathway component GspD/PulD (secretin)